MKLITSTWDLIAYYLLCFGIRRFLIYEDNCIGILLVRKSFVLEMLHASLQGHIV